jgi:MinD-like ATPase involved in chromosome partitioning or flagellar assembly
MDQKKARKLERELEKAIVEIICHLGLRHLPLLPTQRTMKEMAKAAVAVYEQAVDRPDDGSTNESGPE